MSGIELILWWGGAILFSGATMHALATGRIYLQPSYLVRRAEQPFVYWFFCVGRMACSFVAWITALAETIRR